MIKYFTPLLATLLLIAPSCREIADEVNKETESSSDANDNDPYDEEIVDLELYPDWSEATHSNAADPNFDVVFPADEVLRIDLTISTANWAAMAADLKANLSSSNSGFGGMGGGGVTTVDFTPIWVPCTLKYNDKEWYEVGIRYKGNSSLSSTYSSGNDKKSFKLDFDEYEDDYPELKNQRFYGFKQLNLNNNYNDKSFMRERVVSDMFREFGIEAAHTSYCALYVNDSYFGLYTIVEEVDDTVIETQFSDDSGNLYKPEDDAASFAYKTYDEDEFNLKTNTENATYSDVLALYNALQASRTDMDAWKENLESVFDVDRFLKWLAVTITIQNWDTYGNLAHNYFLYNDPSTGLLTWIPWDHNEALQSATGNYYTYTPDQLTNSRYIGSSWPLIYYTINDDDYKAIFDGYLRSFLDEVFIPERMQALYETYYQLIKEYAYAERSGCTFLSYDSQFDSAVSTLKTHVTSRNTSIESYLK